LTTWLSSDPTKKWQLWSWTGTDFPYPTAFKVDGTTLMPMTTTCQILSSCRHYSFTTWSSV
jgi:hypothetical protein